MRQDLELGKQFKIEGFPTLIFHNPKNEEDHDKDIVLFGTRSYEYYVNGLAQVIGTALAVPAAIPSLSILLKEQSFYYAKEISVLYDIKIDKVLKYCRKQLPKGSYQTKSILGEIAIFSTKYS